MKHEDMELPSLAGQFPGLMREVYGDLAKPGVRQVGKALGTVLELGNTALWPVAWANERTRIALETNLEKYRKKLASTPEEEICEVAPELGVPIAEKFAYVTNEELSEMYTELLAKASQVQNAGLAHPGFVNTINNLSPDEAILLRAIRNFELTPFIEVRLKKKGKNEWIILHPMFLTLPCFKDMRFVNNVSAYFSNLEGLGIIDKRIDIFIADDTLYEPLEEHATKRYLQVEEASIGHELSFQRGKIETTLLGRMFVKACIAEPMT